MTAKTPPPIITPDERDTCHRTLNYLVVMGVVIPSEAQAIRRRIDRAERRFQRERGDEWDENGFRIVPNPVVRGQ